MVKRKLKSAAAFGIIFAVIMVFSVQPSFADNYGWGPTLHKGQYYLKFNNDKERLFISKHKNRGFKKTPVDDKNFVSNGKDVLYISRAGGQYYIKSYSIAKKRVKKIRRLPKADGWETCAVKKTYLWIIKNDKCLYRYDIKKNKLKLIKKSAVLQHLYGSYYLGSSESQPYKDLDAPTGTCTMYVSKMSIYQAMDSGKMKLKRSLGSVYGYCNDEHGKLYYSASGGHDMFRIDANGKNKRKIASFSGYVLTVYDGYCCVLEDDSFWKYVYGETEMYEVDDIF